MYTFLFILLTLTNFFVTFYVSKLTQVTKSTAVLFVYAIYEIVAVQLYGIFEIAVILLNLIKPPSFYQTNKSKLLPFFILEMTLILVGYHSIFYIDFIPNLVILNKILNYDRLFFEFSSYIGTVAGAEKIILGYLTGPELCLITLTGTFLYGANELEREQKVQIVDSKIAAAQESIRDLQFRSAARNYASLTPEDRIIYDTKIEAMQNPFIEKQECIGSIQKTL